MCSQWGEWKMMWDEMDHMVQLENTIWSHYGVMQSGLDYYRLDIWVSKDSQNNTRDYNFVILNCLNKMIRRYSGWIILHIILAFCALFSHVVYIVIHSVLCNLCMREICIFICVLHDVSWTVHALSRYFPRMLMWAVFYCFIWIGEA